MPDAAKPVVYAVDDEEHITELIALGLSINGFDVVRLARGRRHSTEIERRQPDLVVLDVMLPDLDGFEVAAGFARSRAPAPGYRSSSSTAKDATADKVHGLKLGVDDYSSRSRSVSRSSLSTVRAVFALPRVRGQGLG